MANSISNLKEVPVAKRRNRTRDASWTTSRRHVLEAIAAAARVGHIAFLRRLGVSYEVAQFVATLDSRVLSDLSGDQDSCSIQISVDNDALRAEIEDNIPVSINRQLAMELLSAGATRNMVKELQLVETNAEFESLMCIAHQGETQVGSRPAALTDKDIRTCHELWRLRVDPESLHPIRHLTQTAQHLNLPVISIWMYVKEAVDLQMVAEGSSWGEQYPWIQSMYPKWGARGNQYGRR